METWPGTLGALQEEAENSPGEAVLTQLGRHREVDLVSKEGRGIPSSSLRRWRGLLHFFFFNAIQCEFIKDLLCSTCRINKIDKTKISVAVDFIFQYRDKENK